MTLVSGETISSELVEQFKTQNELYASKRYRTDRRVDPSDLDTKEAAFFARIFDEATGLPADRGMRNLGGPHYAALAAINQATQEQLTAIHADVQPDSLSYDIYQSDATKQLMESLGRDQQDKITYIARKRYQALNEFIESTVPEPSSEPEHARVFDAVPFAYQGDDVLTHKTSIAARGCFNACFRMVFAAVTGEAIPRESSVALGMYAVADSVLVEDSRYLKAFNTRAFRERYGKTVLTLEMTGATLATIDVLETKLKERHPDRQVIPIVSLLSRASTIQRGSIWHTNVLTGIEDASVTVHDPSDMLGQRWQAGCNRALANNDFHRRWAHALNRAYLVVADPQ